MRRYVEDKQPLELVLPQPPEKRDASPAVHRRRWLLRNTPPCESGGGPGLLLRAIRLLRIGRRLRARRRGAHLLLLRMLLLMLLMEPAVRGESTRVLLSKRVHRRWCTSELL